MQSSETSGLGAGFVHELPTRIKRSKRRVSLKFKDEFSPPAPASQQIPESSSPESPLSSLSEFSKARRTDSRDQASQKTLSPWYSRPMQSENPQAPSPCWENRRPFPISRSSWHSRSPPTPRPSFPRLRSEPAPSPD